jgi:hypothetical protein
MHEVLTQTEQVLASGPESAGEERNKRLEILVCDLLRKNQELRLEVAHLHDRTQVTVL